MNTPRPTPSFSAGFSIALVISLILSALFPVRTLAPEDQTFLSAVLSGLFDSFFFGLLFWYYAKKHSEQLFWILAIALGFSVGDGIQDLVRSAPWWYAILSTLVRAAASLALYHYFVSRLKKPPTDGS